MYLLQYHSWKHQKFWNSSKYYFKYYAFSALTLLVGQQKRHPACKKRVVGCWCGCLEQGADLHMASWCHCHSLSPASVKSRLVLPFWYRLTRVVPEKGPLNGCVRACVRACVCVKVWLSSVALKEPVLMCGNWTVRQATSQQVFRMTTFCVDTCFQSFSTLISRIITTLRWNSAHVATGRCRKHQHYCPYQ